MDIYLAIAFVSALLAIAEGRSTPKLVFMVIAIVALVLSAFIAS